MAAAPLAALVALGMAREMRRQYDEYAAETERRLKQEAITAAKWAAGCLAICAGVMVAILYLLLRR